MGLPITWTDERIMDWSKGPKEADGYLHRRDLAPGTASIKTLPDYSTIFTFVCPCGCGAVTFVGIVMDDDGHRWKWNGDRIAPTLTPSLQTHSACRWHGFVTAGEFVPC